MPCYGNCYCDFCKCPIDENYLQKADVFNTYSKIASDDDSKIAFVKQLQAIEHLRENGETNDEQKYWLGEGIVFHKRNNDIHKSCEEAGLAGCVYDTVCKTYISSDEMHLVLHTFCHETLEKNNFNNFNDIYKLCQTIPNHSIHEQDEFEETAVNLGIDWWLNDPRLNKQNQKRFYLFFTAL